MINFFKKFMETINNNFECYIGIDYEFNKVSKGDREVALMQINLEDNTNIGNVFVLYPPELNKNNRDILIKLITHPKLIKILHGAESLDIPYMFHQLLVTKENIEGFCTNFYDTKYLCDYIHISTNKPGKCSIYNLLLDNQIITQKKFDELEKIEQITGPIYLINIDIHNIDFNVFRYSLYDVLFLVELIKKYFTYGIVYKSILPDITHAIYKYKRNIENEFNQIELLVNQSNLYFIYDNHNIITLQEIWEVYYNIITDKDKYLENIKQINYFRGFFVILTKMIVYYNLNKLFTIYKNKSTKIKAFNISPYIKWLKKYPYLYSLIKEFNSKVNKDLIQILSK